MNAPGWTAERLETARTMWAEGRSASEISKAIGGGLTKSAVVGKIHRMGWKERNAPLHPHANNGSKKARALRQYNKPAVKPPLQAKAFGTKGAPKSTPKPPTPEAPTVLAHTDKVVSLLSLDVHSCRWPIGTPGTARFGFCGAHRGAKAIYCATHAKLAFQTPSTSQKELARSLRRYA